MMNPVNRDFFLRFFLLLVLLRESITYNMFIEIANAAGPDLINSSYELSDVVRIAIALVVLVSGFMAVLFIIWG